MMLPFWKRFCTVLSSIIPSSGCINLVLSAVQLNEEVSDMLLESFFSADGPLKQLILNQNGLDAQGLMFVAKAIYVNASLECLDIQI